MKEAALVALALAAFGCDTSRSDTTSPAYAANTAVDNTKVNARDTRPGTLTPMDQAENEVDRTITQEIRKGVMNDGTLSMTAKNVKIITIDGVVTLRGPVTSDAERADINAIAGRAPNVKRVDNQLEIAAK